MTTHTPVSSLAEVFAAAPGAALSRVQALDWDLLQELLYAPVDESPLPIEASPETTLRWLLPRLERFEASELAGFFRTERTIALVMRRALSGSSLDRPALELVCQGLALIDLPLQHS